MRLFYLIFRVRNILSVIVFLWICNSCNNNEVKYLITEVQPPENFLSDSLFYQRSLSVINDIAACPTVDCANIGLGGTPSGQFKNYKWLSEYASDSLLLKLSNDSSVNVRAYAAQALIERKSVFMKQVVDKFSRDSAQVSFQCGCTTVNIGLDEYLNGIYGYNIKEEKLSF
jgi:hypothetical protein